MKGKEKIKQAAASFDFGEIPPQAIDLEKAILGAILIDQNSFFTINNLIREDFFYKTEHSIIYKNIIALIKENRPVDILTLTDRLRKDGNLDLVGGAYYISELTNSVASSANIEFHAKIVAQKFMQRELIRISIVTANESYSDTSDVFITADNLGSELLKLNTIVSGSITLDWQKETERHIFKTIENKEKGITATGIRTGLYELDQTLQGLRSGLYILGGRPSMGKTAFALDLSMRIIENTGGYVGFFSLEMPVGQLINRLLARETGIDQTRLMNSNISKDEKLTLIERGGIVSSLKLLVTDSPTMTIMQLMSQAKVWAVKNDLKAIFVDYLQLVKGTEKGQQRYLEVGEVSRGLKALSKILDIPVIALCQLTREKEKGANLPALSDLRESGDIEQDADCVMLLYRPEYYNINEDSEGNSTKGLTKIIIPKHRNGSVNVQGANVRSDLSINRYWDWDSKNEIPLIMNSQKSFASARTEIDLENLPF